MKIFYKALIITVPIWILTALDIFILPNNWLSKILQWISLPGYAFYVVFNPSWKAIHDYNDLSIFLINAIFYLFVIFLILLIREKRN